MSIVGRTCGLQYSMPSLLHDTENTSPQLGLHSLCDSNTIVHQMKEPDHSSWHMDRQAKKQHLVTHLSNLQNRGKSFYLHFPHHHLNDTHSLFRSITSIFPLQRIIYEDDFCCSYWLTNYSCCFFHPSVQISVVNLSLANKTTVFDGNHNGLLLEATTFCNDFRLTHIFHLTNFTSEHIQNSFVKEMETTLILVTD